VSVGQVEPDRVRRLHRDGRDNVSSPSAVQMSQIAAGDSTCPIGFRGRAGRRKASAEAMEAEAGDIAACLWQTNN